MINKQDSIFNVKGYFKDYYYMGKYMGSMGVSQPDREVFSYFGRITETLTQDITLNNKKRLKKGDVVVTELQKICGRLK